MDYAEGQWQGHRTGWNVLQAFMGHRDPESTKVYTHTYESRDTLAASRLVLPRNRCSVEEILLRSVNSSFSYQANLPFFVGAPGFEPGTSWSRRFENLRDPAKLGRFSGFELHEVHRVTQGSYNVPTVVCALAASSVCDCS